MSIGLFCRRILPINASNESRFIGGFELKHLAHENSNPGHRDWLFFQPRDYNYVSMILQIY